MSSNIALHVGFSKTGATTLQQFLFSKHSRIEYLGKPYTDDILKSHLSRLIGQESLVYDHSPLAEYFSKKILKNERHHRIDLKKELNHQGSIRSKNESNFSDS
jgi:hypothetical protein